MIRRWKTSPTIIKCKFYFIILSRNSWGIFNFIFLMMNSADWYGRWVVIKCCGSTIYQLTFLSSKPSSLWTVSKIAQRNLRRVSFNKIARPRDNFSLYHYTVHMYGCRDSAKRRPTGFLNLFFCVISGRYQQQHHRKPVFSWGLS